VKFLVDECTGIWVSKQLRQMGFDSVSVIEVMKGADDQDIIRRAIEEDRVIITNDKYLGRLAGFYKLPGVILLRLKDESVENKVKVISFVVASHSKLILGNVTVVSENKIRVRRIRRAKAAGTSDT
jgi:predicted nuclease of predicted toxin-antitoxin system